MAAFSSLSGGEKTKVLLGLLFIEENAFPLIDEPTNHLDLAGRQQVAEYLKKKKHGFILVSHDRHLLMK
jgi:lincosamide and streptogramin A transport system ATP-binding/permease protein